MPECQSEVWTEPAHLALPQNYEENELLFILNSRLSTSLALPIHVANISLPVEPSNWEYIYADNTSQEIWSFWASGHPGSSGLVFDRCSRMLTDTSLWLRSHCSDYNTFACQVPAAGKIHRVLFKENTSTVFYVPYVHVNL